MKSPAQLTPTPPPSTSVSINTSSATQTIFKTTDDKVATSDYMDNFENILTPGKEPDMTKEYKPKVANRFEKYLNPQTLKRHVLRSEKVRNIIEHYAKETNTSPKQIEGQVKEIIDEIALDRNLAIIRWCGVAITSIGKRICSGIHVNAANIDTVENQLGNNPVLYLPSHRSYMDFILMSYICFHYGIEIPGIAAGMDFHSMFAIGTMLRKTGAFFMRRSFSNDELYWDIFREYMYALVAVYHIGIEFFIEGTRSRNFKALVPKVGLLSMALLPYFTGEVNDITIVPVSISYERVLEEQLFVYELLGVPKPKETTKGFFKALKIIDERFGNMFMDFGEPISVHEFFQHCSKDFIKRSNLGGEVHTLNRKELDLVKKLANEVINQQQRRIVINTFNLLCLYYADQLYSKRAVNIDELSRGIGKLKHLFEELGAHVSTNMNSIKPEIIETVEIHSNIVHFRKANLKLTAVAANQLAQKIDPKRLKAHALQPQTMALAVPALALQLYINPCLFWLARPAFLMLSALQIQREQQYRKSLKQDPMDRESILKELFERVSILYNIFKHEFIIESSREDEEFKRNLSVLETFGIIRIFSETGEIVIGDNEYGRVILSALSPFLCVYYQLAVTLNKFPSNSEFTNKEILILMQDRVEQLLQNSQETPHVHPYCLALDNLNIALYYFVQDRYLIKDKNNGLFCHSKEKSLQQLENELLKYCELMPFSHYYENSGAEPQEPWLSSKL